MRLGCYLCSEIEPNTAAGIARATYWEAVRITELVVRIVGGPVRIPDLCVHGNDGAVRITIQGVRSNNKLVRVTRTEDSLKRVPCCLMRTPLVVTRTTLGSMSVDNFVRRAAPSRPALENY